MMDRHSEVNKKFKEIKKRIHVSSHNEYAITLEALKHRLHYIVDQIFANELFDNGSLKLDDLDKAQTLDEVTAIVDNFESIARFYEANYRVMAPITEMKVFQDEVAKEGDLNCWDAITSHHYKGLTRRQSTVLVLDTLTRHHEDTPESMPKPKS